MTVVLKTCCYFAFMYMKIKNKTVTPTCKSYHEDVHSVDKSHDSCPFSHLKLLKISVQQCLTMAYMIPYYREQRALQRQAVGLH